MFSRCVTTHPPPPFNSRIPDTSKHMQEQGSIHVSYGFLKARSMFKGVCFNELLLLLQARSMFKGVCFNEFLLLLHPAYMCAAVDIVLTTLFLLQYTYLE